MTFDPEHYRAELAPLNLPKEKEDELLADLWKIMEVLVDSLQDPNFYPLHFAIATGALDSLEDAIALASKKASNGKEAP